MFFKCILLESEKQYSFLIRFMGTIAGQPSQPICPIKCESCDEVGANLAWGEPDQPCLRSC